MRLEDLPKLDAVEKEVYRRFGAMNPEKYVYSEHGAYDVNDVIKVTSIMYEGEYVWSYHFSPKCKLNKTRQGTFFDLFGRKYRTCRKREVRYRFEDDRREWYVDAYCINDYVYAIYVQRRVKLHADFIMISQDSKRVSIRPASLDVKSSFDEAMLEIVNNSKDISKQYELLAKLDEELL